MALFGKVFACISKSRATVRHCHSGISSPPGLAVEELKKRHGFGPWLMFADAENDKRDPAGGGFRRCYSFLSGEFFSLPAPQLQGRRCWGTRYGWLITYSSDGDAHLFNPLTHHQLPLPSRLTFNQLRPYKIERDDQTSFFDGFSFSSHSDRLVVMTRYGLCSKLAFSSPGDEAWNYLNDSESSESSESEFSESSESETKFLDLDIANVDTIFYRGQFYTIDCGGRLKVCDITSGKLEEKLINTFGDAFRYYLVEISGHLHLICRAYVKTIKTKSFDIYRFDFQENKWISIDHLDGHSVFVGNNTTFAISTTDYPEIKPDCIYFTDDYSHYYGRLPFRDDTGVYDFASKSLVDPVPFIKGDKSPYSKFSRPTFFIPSLSHL